MLNFVLYCCTFRKDLKRTVKLAQSIERHNKTRIPFYISVPEGDVILFRESLKDFDVIVFDEKDIFQANPKLNIQNLYEIRGGLRQQVIKSEFWRLGISENYLVLDADCIFIRDFCVVDIKAIDPRYNMEELNCGELLSLLMYRGGGRVIKHTYVDGKALDVDMACLSL